MNVVTLTDDNFETEVNISKFADGAVVGSAFLDSIENADNEKTEAGVDFVKNLAN